MCYVFFYFSITSDVKGKVPKVITFMFSFGQGLHDERQLFGQDTYRKMNRYCNMNTGLDGNDDGFPHTLSQTRGVKRCLTFISNDEQHVEKKKCSVTEMNSHVVSVDHGVVGNKKWKIVCSDESLLTTIKKDKGMLCHSQPQHMSKDNNCKTITGQQGNTEDI